MDKKEFNKFMDDTYSKNVNKKDAVINLLSGGQIPLGQSDDWFNDQLNHRELKWKN